MDQVRVRVDTGVVVAAQRLSKVGFGHVVPRQRDVDGNRLRRRTTPGQADQHLVDGLAGHLLGGVHGAADRPFGKLHIDDHAAAQPLADLVADADDARPAAVIDPADEANDLGGADIQHGDQPAFRPGA